MAEKIKFVWPDRSAVSRGAFAVVKKLRAGGHAAYFAGGAVRDALLKRPVKEIDIATSALPAQVKKLFKKTIPTGEKHGTITVFDPLSISPLPRRRKKWGYEVTTFRAEGPYLDSRRPSKVKFIKSAADDAGRRDFTVNALFYDPAAGIVFDYVGGLVDLKKKLIRMVGDPEARIKEDALRMLRGVRLATTLRFEFQRDTRRAIQAHAPRIKKISAERVKQELDKIMLSDRISVGLGLLDVCGLLPHVLPEVENLKGASQPRNQHSEGDVYAHTLLAMEQCGADCDLATRYAALFHDLGKPATRVLRGKKITFYNHTALGADLAHKLCRRLKFSNQEIDKITWLVKNHLVPNDFAQMKLSTRRRWGLMPYFADLLRLFRADTAASLRPSGKAEPRPAGFLEGQKILRELENKPALRQPLLSGTEVMKILKISPGPMVGKILRALDEKKLSGEIKNKKQAEEFLKKSKKLLDKKLSTL